MHIGKSENQNISPNPITAQTDSFVYRCNCKCFYTVFFKAGGDFISTVTISLRFYNRHQLTALWHSRLQSCGIVRQMCKIKFNVGAFCFCTVVLFSRSPFPKHGCRKAKQ